MQWPRLLGFLAVVLLLSVLLHALLLLRLAEPFRPALSRNAWLALRAAAAVSAVVVPAAMLLIPLVGRPLTDRLQSLAYLWMGFFSIALGLLLLKDLGWLLLRGLDRVLPDSASPLPADPERRRFLALGLNSLVLGASAVLGSAAAVVARRRAKLVELDVPVTGLHPALDGFRIVQMSDIHVASAVRREEIEELVAASNALSPDLVAITGDLVDGPVRTLLPHLQPLRDLRSRHGSFFVTGNHEYYSGVHAWCDAVRGLGCDVLLNEHRLLSHGDARLLVAGVTDLTARQMEPSHRSDPRRAMDGAPEGGFRLLLAHQPESIRAARDLGFHLQLSGHTHGGQYFPYTFFIRLIKKWVAGMYRVGGTWVYVNRGATFWGPPMRLGSEQELTLLVLRRLA
jgi:predicted MPP superfamily phosphohydrolase